MQIEVDLVWLAIVVLSVLTLTALAVLHKVYNDLAEAKKDLATLDDTLANFFEAAGIKKAGGDSA